MYNYNKPIYVVHRTNEDTNEMYHHGVKGQKWGIRRYQNKDGSLTPEGKKRLSKEYQNYIGKAHKEIDSKEQQRYAKAYGKAVDEMNNGLLTKYNSDYAKKLGTKAKNHDYLNDEKYNKGIEKILDELTTKHYSDELVRDIKNSKYYKKAKELCYEYDMTSFDELARETDRLLKDYY